METNRFLNIIYSLEIVLDIVNINKKYIYIVTFQIETNIL